MKNPIALDKLHGCFLDFLSMDTKTGDAKGESLVLALFLKDRDQESFQSKHNGCVE
jgi:hypothetical protein